MIIVAICNLALISPLDVSEDLFLSPNSLRYLGAGNESCELVLLQFWGHLVKTRALQ